LVFTDIVDSTSLGKRLGDERWIELLQKHFAQARSLMEKYDHHEIKIIGDSFMVIFRTAVDALDFALSLNQETGDPNIKIRAGIHVGSARIIGDDIFGNMVNYTKRVESTENPAGITLSEVAMAQIKDENAKRHDRLQYLDKQVSFKGLGEPQRVFAVKEKKPIQARARTHEGVIDELPVETRAVAKRILSWSRERFSRVEWNNASFVPVLEYGAEYSHNPITVYCRGKVARVGVKFGRMKTRNRLSKVMRETLLEKLNKIPGVNLPQHSIDRYPVILLSTFSSNDSLDKFFDAIEWTIQGVKAAQGSKSERAAGPQVKKSSTPNGPSVVIGNLKLRVELVRRYIREYEAGETASWPKGNLTWFKNHLDEIYQMAGEVRSDRLSG